MSGDVSPVSVPVRERYYIQIKVRTWYSPVWGWFSEQKVLELGVDAHLTGRIKVTNSEALELEVRLKTLTNKKRDLDTWWKRFLVAGGFAGEYETVEEEVTRWIDESKFYWQSVVSCNSEQ